MASNVAETVIGASVLLVAGGFLVYAANTTDVALGAGGYDVKASFYKAEGLNIGGDVQVAGVKIGVISDIRLDPATFKAIVTMNIRDAYKLPEDSSVKIVSDGLLGGNYIRIEPGNYEFNMEPGGEFENVQSSVNLSDLISRFVQGSGSE